MNKYLFRIAGGATMLFAALLLNSCAPSYLSAGYQKMPTEPTEDERVISTVLAGIMDGGHFVPMVRNGTIKMLAGVPVPVPREGSTLMMIEGVLVQVPRTDAEWLLKSQSRANKSVGGAYSGGLDQRHPDEYVLDRLLSMAKTRFPNETIDLRNATVKTNSIVDKYGQTMYLNAFIADIVTTEPMPAPIAHSSEFSLTGASQADLFQRVSNRLYNWESDNATRVEELSATPNGDGIRGKYIFKVFYGQENYEITSSFSIDTYDQWVRVTHTNSRLQRKGIFVDYKSNAMTSKELLERGDTIAANKLAELTSKKEEIDKAMISLDEQQGIVGVDYAGGNPQIKDWFKEKYRLQKINTGVEEPIFLQSLANLVTTELSNFSENLKQSILSQRQR